MNNEHNFTESTNTYREKILYNFGENRSNHKIREISLREKAKLYRSSSNAVHNEKKQFDTGMC